MNMGTEIYQKVQLYNIFGEHISNIISQFLHPTFVEYVVNIDYGSFGISEEAYRLYCGKKGEEFYIENYNRGSYLSRTDIDLINVIKELGDKANNKYSRLRIRTVFTPLKI